MKILYGTMNQAKLAAMQSRLEDMDIEIVGPADVGAAVLDVPETGSTPLENARRKADAYYKAFCMPVFACDSGLYFENVPDALQPGVHVRNIGGRRLTDEEMAVYYAGLAKQYGNLTAAYQNAVCLILDDAHRYEAMDASMRSAAFMITDKRRKIRKEGFPIDSLSIDIETGKHFYDLPQDKVDRLAVEDGFLEFFRNIEALWQK